MAIRFLSFKVSLFIELSDFCWVDEYKGTAKDHGKLPDPFKYEFSCTLLWSYERKISQEYGVSKYKAFRTFSMSHGRNHELSK